MGAVGCLQLQVDHAYLFTKYYYVHVNNLPDET